MKNFFILFFLSVISTIHSQLSVGEIRDELPETPSVGASGSQCTTGTCNNDISQCAKGRCVNVPYKEIQRMFRGIFFTKTEIKRKMMILKYKINDPVRVQDYYPKKWWKSNKKSSRRSRYVAHDGDHCCPTYCNSTYPTELHNTRGVLRYIVHFTDMKPDPMYQFIPTGTCGPTGTCNNCQQQDAIHSLLVIDTTFKVYPYFEFDEFYLPSYCSCRG